MKSRFRIKEHMLKFFIEKRYTVFGFDFYIRIKVKKKGLFTDRTMYFDTLEGAKKYAGMLKVKIYNI